MTRTESSHVTRTRGTHRTTTARTVATRGRARRLVGVAVALSDAGVRAKKWLSQAWAWALETIRPAGLVVIVAATVGLVFGAIFGWTEWLVAGWIGIVLVVLSLPFLFGGRSYDIDLSITHDRVVAGDAVEGQILVRNSASRPLLPGRLDVPVGAGLIEVAVPLLRPSQVFHEPVSIPSLRRGIVTVGPVSTVRSDPIGLLHREHAFDELHELYVHPRTTELPSTSSGLIRDLEGQATRQLVDSDMSFHAIREYAPGDSQRQVHWKSTAKTGQLMVRQYEESRRSRMAVVLASNEAEYLDADEFELAVSCAASLGLRAVRDARELEIVAGSAIPRVVRGRFRAMQRVPTVSPRVMMDGFSGLEMFENAMRIGDVCQLVVESSEQLSVAFLIVGSPFTLTQLRQLALVFPLDTVVFAVICDERAHPRMQSLGTLTVLTVGTVDDLAGLLVRGVSAA